MMLKRIAMLFVSLITILCSLPVAANTIAVSAQENSNSDVIILSSIEQDLESFNFDVSRYYLSKENYIHPVVITFKESNTSSYYDLMYVYVRLDPVVGLKGQLSYPNINFTSVDVDYYYNDNLKNLYDNTSNENSNFSFIYSDKVEVVENGYVYRLAIDGYEKYRTSNYREYNFTKLNYNQWTDSFVPGKPIPFSVEIENTYLFDNKLSLIYSNCINIIAEDAHCWSYHFDEDNWWENVCDWFGGNRSDILTDQLFYSFYVENWDINELKSIDIRYKKALLEGFRYNEHDTGKDKEFYEGTSGSDYDPKYYLWNDNNKKDNFDTSVYLGNSIQKASNSISYTNRTIYGNVINSANTQFKEYEWKSILNNFEFGNTFGVDSEIYKHAANFLTEPLREYWIINFDQYYYFYSILDFFFKRNILVEPYQSFITVSNHNLDYYNYLKKYDLEEFIQIDIGGNNVYYHHYNFLQEYVFDMTATQMTFEDNGGVVHTLPVSVAPVTEEGSGGGSLRPLDGLDINGLLQLIALIFGILILICFMPILGTVFTFLINIISIPLKLITKLFNKKE